MCVLLYVFFVMVTGGQTGSSAVLAMDREMKSNLQCDKCVSSWAER